MENKPQFITQENIKLLISIAVFLIPIFLCWASIETKLALIQQDLSTIRSNDLAHIEIELTDMKARNSVADDRQRNMELQITKITSTLDLQKSNLDTFNAK